MKLQVKPYMHPSLKTVAPRIEPDMPALESYIISEIGTSLDACREILTAVEHIRCGSTAKWEGTGNAYTLVLSSEDAVIENEKRKILITGGEIQLSREGLVFDEQAESFWVKVRKDGEEITSVVDEFNGELVTVKSGGSKVSVVPLSGFEKSVSEKLQYDSPVSIDEAIDKIDGKLVELRNLLNYSIPYRHQQSELYI